MPAIHFRTSGRTVEFDPGDEVNLLRVAIRNECGVPYKCASGNCGTDRVHVESGHEHLSPVRKKERDRLGDDVDHGYRLACQTYTSGDVTLSWDATAVAVLPERAAEKLRERWLAQPDDAPVAGEAAPAGAGAGEAAAPGSSAGEAAAAGNGAAEAVASGGGTGAAAAEAAGVTPAGSGWVAVGTRQELERVKKKAVDVGEHQVVVVWHDGRPYAMDNICIHQQRELVKGVVLNGRLVCPGHQWAYELGTGYCRERDRTQPVFAAMEEDGTVYVAGEPAAPDEGAPVTEREEAVWPRTST